MKKLVVGLLALVGAMAIVAVFILVAVGLLSTLGGESVPARVILEADFEQALVEWVPEDPLARLMLDDISTVRDVVDAIDRGAVDDRVKVLVARIGGGGIGMAHLQEIRDAVLRFRDAGKPAIAWAETFGEFGPGNRGYYLATAFDEVHLQPSGDIGLTGGIFESMFLRGTLDKLGVQPQIEQRYEYKNAANGYTQERYTAAHREAMQSILESWFAQQIDAIAAARNLDAADVRGLFDDGPYIASEALDRGLVDKLSYRDEVYARAREIAGGKRAKTLYLGPYLERAGRPHRRGDTIALIHGYGAVTRGASTFSPFDGSVTMGSDTVAAAFRAAVRDDAVKAIVFRVDSPGGSYVASDTIWRETVRAREAGKPVIVSMGNLAGSGGYFVAMNADQIVAEPGTITASIGVFGGKLVTRDLWSKLGVSWDSVQTSDNGTMWSTINDYDGEEFARLQNGMDRIYEDFTGKVAAGRGLAIERVREIARGRIWTGEQAKELGLVDEVGGLGTALRLARKAAGLDPDGDTRIKVYPRPRSIWDLWLRTGSDGSERAAQQALVQSLRALQPYVRTLREIGLFGNRGVLTMPHPLPPS